MPNNEQKCTVYALASSSDGVIRYIGQTKRSVNKRLQCHLSEAKSKKSTTHRNNWIRSVLESGDNVIAIVLDNDAIWNNTEIILISKYKELGFNLVNSTSGGEGTRDMPQEVRDKISKKSKGRKISDEQRRKMSEAKKGLKFSPEHRAKMAAGIRKAYIERGDEIKTKISKAHKGRKHSEEWCRKIGAAKKGQKHTKETCEIMSKNMKEYFLDEKNRKKTSEATKKAMAREDVKERLDAGIKKRWSNPEMRKQASNSAKSRFSKNEEREKQARRRAHLSDEQVIAAREMRKNGVKNADLSKLFGIAEGAMSQLCSGKTYKHIPIE